MTQVANVGNEDAVTVQQESGVLAPGSSQLTRAQAFLQQRGVQRRSCCAAHVVDVSERRPRDVHRCCYIVELKGSLGVAAG